MVRNTLAIEDGYDPSTASIRFYWRRRNEKAQSFMAEKKDQWLWPLHGARIGDRLVLFYCVVGPDHTPDSLGFKVQGSTAFLVDNPDAEPDHWHLRELAVPKNSWNITLGVAALQRDELLYLFAFDEPKHDVYLARLPATIAASGDLSQLEWWCGEMGHNWRKQDELRQAPASIIKSGSTELSVHFDPLAKRFVEVQSRGFGASTIAKRSSAELTGPWSSLEDIYTPPESKQREPFVYAGKAHPELTGDDLIVTYAANGSEKRLTEDMSIYFPRFVRASFAQPELVRILTPVSIPKDTKIRIGLDCDVNSKTSVDADEFSARTEEEITVDGSLVLPVGTPILGRVLCQQDPQHMRRRAISLVFDKIILSDGRQIPLVANLVARGGKVHALRGFEDISLVASTPPLPILAGKLISDCGSKPHVRKKAKEVETPIRQSSLVVSDWPRDCIGLIADEKNTVDLRAGDQVKIELTKDLQINPK